MRAVNEDTAAEFEVEYADTSGVPITPSTARFRVDNTTTGDIDLPWQEYTPSGSSDTLRVPSTAHKVTTNSVYEDRAILVQTDFDAESSKNTTEYRYRVKNLYGVGNSANRNRYYD